MNIFLDESGSFVSAPKENSWNCIVAYMVPEFERRKLSGTVTELKKSRGIPQNKEVKLREIHEEGYFSFLRNLAKLKGTLHRSTFTFRDVFEPHGAVELDPHVPGHSPNG